MLLCLLAGIASDGKSAIIPIMVLWCAQLLSWGAFQVFLFITGSQQFDYDVTLCTFLCYLSCLALARLPRLVVWYFKSDPEQLFVPWDCSYRAAREYDGAAGLCSQHWLQSEPFLLLSYSSLTMAGRLWTIPWWCSLLILMALCNPLLFMRWPCGLLLITSTTEYCRDGILS